MTSFLTTAELDLLEAACKASGDYSKDHSLHGRRTPPPNASAEVEAAFIAFRWDAYGDYVLLHAHDKLIKLYGRQCGDWRVRETCHLTTLASGGLLHDTPKNTFVEVAKFNKLTLDDLIEAAQDQPTGAHYPTPDIQAKSDEDTFELLLHAVLGFAAGSDGRDFFIVQVGNDLHKIFTDCHNERLSSIARLAARAQHADGDGRTAFATLCYTADIDLWYIGAALGGFTEV